MLPPLHLHATVQPGEEKLRLDRWLALHIPSWSRSQLQRRIRDGSVHVNGKPATAHHALRSGDQIDVSYEAPKATEPNSWKNIRLIAETADELVIEKPSGVLVHPAPSSNERTLVDWILERYPEVRTVGEDPQRPGLVHRIDRDVSGVMIIARTQESFESLKQQFQDRTISKTYLALVHGTLPTDGTIDFPIARSKTHRARMAAGPNLIGRAARTNYRIERAYPAYTFLKVFPETGRMHQIRVHLFAIGHPIVGDHLYQMKSTPKNSLSRPFLHAAELSFSDRSGQPRTYRSLLPPELTAELARLDGEAEDR